jgi:hypothetical protein
VQSVVADAAANRVVVAGTAEAAALKARIEAKTKMPVEIVSAGAGPNKPAPAESKSGGEKKISEKDGGRGDKKNHDKGGGGDKGDKASSSKPQPKKEEKEKKQPPEEKKDREVGRYTRGNPIPTQYSPLPCSALNYYASEVKVTVTVTGTMDDAAMVGYLTENRTVEAVAPGKKDGSGGDDKKDKGSGEKKKDKAAAGDDIKEEKGKGIEVVGPSMAPAPVQANTHHVSPYGHVPYPQPQGPPPGYHQHPGSYDQQNPDPQPYPQYRFDMAPAPQMFSDENPNACSVM